ncbi:MAG: acyltransferase [Pseudonocardiales bacterium]|nr:acyltransferase [Pseudonocardiales bacterium]
MAVQGSARWPALDGLRAIAVLLVVGFHASGFLYNGYLGVDVFFVLSGFLITGILRREIDDTGRLDLRRFYTRRGRRLYPALLAMCVIVTASALVTGQHALAVLLGAITSIGYVANIWEYTGGHDTFFFQHTWTLALEEQFYVVWPVLLLAIIRWRTAAWAVGGACIALEVADLLLDQPPALNTYVRALGLPLGCVLAFAMNNQRLIQVLRLLAVPALLSLIVLAVIPVRLEGLLAGWPVGLAALLTVPVVAGLVSDGRGSRRLVRVLSWRPAVGLGHRSYGLYLWHFPVLTLLINHAPLHAPLVARLVIGVGLSLAAAAISYRWIEQPFCHRGRPASTMVARPGSSPVTLVAP